ncbi:MAG: helix-turn-helix domain-containing protein [Bacteroidales bacterium]|jgi:transcriptional regulator with XRE-family HTH domain|nr:helix-turn-helix domain-containing protein [Bacteroidales bacterium]
MKDRLNKVISSEGLTPSLLADEMGIQRSGISHILSGRNNPSFDFIQKILTRFPKLNAEWLILGKGAMYKNMPEEVPDLFSSISGNDKTPLSPTPPIQNKESSSGEGDESTSAENKVEISPLKELKEKRIERIVVFYTDHTFSAYSSE